MHDLIIASIEKGAFQLEQVLKDLPEEAWARRVVPTAMTPFETVEHLVHCYGAFLATSSDEAFDWSVPFKLASTQLHEAMLDLERIRQEAINRVRTSPEEKVLGLALDYMIQHDSYHIGQLALFRMSIDPNWDPYSLYQH